MNGNLYALLASRFPADRAQAAFRWLGGAAISYGELEAGAGRLAALLKAKGVTPGDRVAVQTAKSPEAVMLYLAALKVGAVFLPLNTAYTAAEIDYFVGDAEPALFVTDAVALAREAAELAPLDAVHEAAPRRPGRDRLHQRHHRPLQGRDAEPRALAANGLALTEAWGFTAPTCCCTRCRSTTSTASSSPCTASCSPARACLAAEVRRGPRCWRRCPARP